MIQKAPSLQSTLADELQGFTNLAVQSCFLHTCIRRAFDQFSIRHSTRFTRETDRLMQPVSSQPYVPPYIRHTSSNEHPGHRKRAAEKADCGYLSLSLISKSWKFTHDGKELNGGPWRSLAPGLAGVRYT